MFTMKQSKRPCLEYPNCECPKCNAYSERIAHADRDGAEGRVIGECHYCGGKATTRDHKRPKSKGGGSANGNVVPACRLCNQIKGSMDYEEFLAFIGKKV